MEGCFEFIILVMFCVILSWIYRHE